MTPRRTTQGERGPAVVDCQRHAMRHYGYRGALDGLHGPETEAACRRWDDALALAAGGLTGPMAPPRLVPVGAAESCWADDVRWDPGHDAGVRAEVALLVIHSAECEPTDRAAAAVAAYLAGYRGGSAHYVVGPGVVIQQVPEAKPAWTCGPRGNHLAIQIECAGRAMSTDWTSGDGLRVVRRCGGLGRDICQRWQIPIVVLDSDAVRAGMRGVCSHDSITRGLGGTTHVDPGGPGDARWPWETWLDAAGW